MFEIEKQKLERAEEMVEYDQLRQNYVETLSAKAMAEISERKAHERAQATIICAARRIVDYAHSGCIRSHLVENNHPDVGAYFRERGFTVEEANHGSGFIVKW